MVGRILSEQECIETVQRLLSFEPEDEILEYKEMKNGFSENDLGKYFSALSNEATLREAECAWLLFGVSDKREVVGTSVLPTKESRSNIRKKIADLTTNRLTFSEIYEVFIDGKRVLLFQIPPALGTVVMFNGIPYGRDGDSLVGLNPEKYHRIQSRFVDWSAETIDCTVDDLDPDAMATARELYIKNNPKSKEMIEPIDDERFFSHIGLIKKGKLTRTAALLFGDNSKVSAEMGPLTEIRWSVWKNGMEILDYEHFGIPFVFSADNALGKIANYKYTRVMEGATSETMSTYDPDTLREALNNAIMHNDYRKDRIIDIKEVQSECIVFSNAGSFLPGSINNVLFDRKRTAYRNWLLAETMYRFGFVEYVGLGMKSMFMAQAKRYFPLPEYECDDDRVSVTITGHPIQQMFGYILHRNKDLSFETILALDKLQKKKSLSNNEAESLRDQGFLSGDAPNYVMHMAEYVPHKPNNNTELHERVLQFIRNHGCSTRAEIEEWLLEEGLMEPEKIKNGLKWILRRLVLKGLIENRGNNRKPHYCIVIPD